MKVTFSSTQSDKRDAVVVTSLSSAKLRNAAVALDTKTGGALTRAVRATGFKGNAGQNISISGPANEDAKHVVIAGLGKSAELDGKKLQANGKSLTAIFNQNGVKKSMSSWIACAARKRRIWLRKWLWVPRWNPTALTNIKPARKRKMSAC